MKKILLPFLVLSLALPCFFLLKKEELFTDITKKGQEQYQDIVINNVVVKKASGNHESETRYRIIQQALNRYQRPFTMLDLGASQGYYTFRTAHDYDAVCVMIEGNNRYYPRIGTQLLQLCKANDQLNNVIFLNKPLIIEDLHQLSQCESFDVVLALNILHWFGDRWRELTDIVLNMGDTILIETPPEEPFLSEDHNHRRKEIIDYLLSKNAIILGYAPRHTSPSLQSAIYLIDQQKKGLDRKTWFRSLGSAANVEIASNFTSKVLRKKTSGNSPAQEKEWVAGINLLTFKMYNGVYPTPQMLKRAVKKIADREATDWAIQNMILQGNRIALIDQDDPRFAHRKRKPTKKQIKNHYQILDIQDPKEVKNYYWKKIG